VRCGPAIEQLTCNGDTHPLHYSYNNNNDNDNNNNDNNDNKK